MSKPDDTELERYLAGEHPVSQHYHAAGDETPSPALDEAVRQQARTAVEGHRRSRWPRAIAAAAVLVLCVGVVFRLQYQPQEQPQPAPASKPAGTAADEVAPAAEIQRRQPDARSRAVQPRVQANTQSLAAPNAQTITPQMQLALVRQRLETGKLDDVLHSMPRFISKLPDYSDPDRLEDDDAAARLDATSIQSSDSAGTPHLPSHGPVDIT